MIRAVIFDIDGTLVDSVDLHARAWHESFSHFGLNLERSDVRKQIGKGGDQLMPVFLSQAQLESFGESLSDFRSKLWKSRYLPQVRAFPQVRELLSRVRHDGKRVVLASSAPRDELDSYKRIANIVDLVEIETSADDVERSKPHPDVFLSALEKAGVSDARTAIVVGDSPYDVLAALKAQLPVVGVLTGGFSPDELRAAGCTIFYRDAADLLARYEESPLAG